MYYVSRPVGVEQHPSIKLINSFMVKWMNIHTFKINHVYIDTCVNSGQTLLQNAQHKPFGFQSLRISE